MNKFLDSVKNNKWGYSIGVFLILFVIVSALVYNYYFKKEELI